VNALNRKGCRKLKYEMDLYQWGLVKLPNGKTKAVIVKEDIKEITRYKFS
jgi:hypothetical protein